MGRVGLNIGGLGWGFSCTRRTTCDKQTNMHSAFRSNENENAAGYAKTALQWGFCSGFFPQRVMYSRHHNADPSHFFRKTQPASSKLLFCYTNETVSHHISYGPYWPGLSGFELEAPWNIRFTNQRSFVWTVLLPKDNQDSQLVRLRNQSLLDTACRETQPAVSATVFVKTGALINTAPSRIHLHNSGAFFPGGLQDRLCILYIIQATASCIVLCPLIMFM